MKRKLFGTVSLLTMTFCLLCMWTWWGQEPKAAVAVREPVPGSMVAAQKIFAYAAWTDREFSGGKLVQLSLHLPSEEEPSLGMTLHVRGTYGTSSRSYVFEDLQYIKEENGNIIFSVKQKNEVDLVQTD